MRTNISFIVCGNGYGHLKRTLLVVDEINRLKPKLLIRIFCREEHVAFASNEVNFKNQRYLEFDTELSKNEISWIQKDKISITAYRDWEQTLVSNSKLKDSQLIVSDNHFLPSRLFEHALLMGSFLWHEATVNLNKEMHIIAEEEKAFLKNNPRELICVGDIVMPEAENQTQAYKLPWFCDRFESDLTIPVQSKVLITGGGTELTNQSLLEITEILTRSNPNIKFCLDRKLYKSCSFQERRNIDLFGFENEEFASLKAIVCRPGIGILTDCVRYSVPALVVNDCYNKEISHNARRVAEMQIGAYYLLNEMKAEEIALSISDSLNNQPLLNTYKSNLKVRRTGGALEAARIILQKLETL